MVIQTLATASALAPLADLAGWFADRPLHLAAAAALLALALAAIGETVHARRVRRVRHLAFGPAGEPAPIARLAPPARTLGLTLAAFGAACLAVLEPNVKEAEPTKEASKHVLVCMDSSPSMFIADAGPRTGPARNAEPQRRIVRAGDVVQAVLDRADPRDTRVTVFSVYRGGIPVAAETYDKEAVRNFFDGLPMYAAFEPGPTDLRQGVADALDFAKRWPRDSAMLVIVSDGDTSAADRQRDPIRALPTSIADVLVLGVGDPRTPTTIDGHRSKQDAQSLRTLAARLGGTYLDTNERQVPSALLASLTVTRPRLEDRLGLRELALASIALGSALCAAVPPVLALAGRPASANT